MKKTGLSILMFLIILSSCEKHEFRDDHRIIIDDTHTINAIAVDVNNTKWVGTSIGLFIVEDNKLSPIDTISFGEVSSLLYEENSNILWIGTKNGLIKAVLNNQAFSSVVEIPFENLSDPHIQCAYIDTSLKKWFGTELGFTLNVEEKWKNDSFRINKLNRIFRMKSEKIGINSITRWKGDLYFATEGSSMWRGKDYKDEVDAFTGESQWVSPYNGRNMTSILNVVFADSRNQLWMGGRNGIQVFSGDSAANPENYAYYDTDLPDSVINVIAEAPDGNIWVGMEKGLSVLESSFWTTITEELPDSNVTAIAFDKNYGITWIGTKKGMVRLKN
jgi:ligand-binding sensor domain-containing protein